MKELIAKYWKPALAVVLLALAAVWLNGLGAAGRQSEVATDYGTAGQSVGTGQVAGSEPSYADSTAMKSAAAPAGSAGMAAAPEAQRSATAESGVSDRKVIKSRTLGLEVADVRAKAKELERLTAAAKGYVESLSFYSDNNYPVQPLADGTAEYRSSTDSGDSADPRGGTLIIRVPAAGLDAFVKQATALGRVLDESANSQDVTEQHADTTARLKNMKAQENRLRSLYGKAEKISDMLAIETELTRVRGEIESMEAQLKSLNQSVAMATLSVNLQKKLSAVEPSGPDWGFDEALRGAVTNFVNVINGLVMLTGSLLPLLILAGAAWGAWKLVAAGRKKRAGQH